MNHPPDVCSIWRSLASEEEVSRGYERGKGGNGQCLEKNLGTLQMFLIM